MKKRTSNLKLLKLYFNYCFNIKSIVILVVSLLLLSLTIFLLCNYNETSEYYLSNYNEIHTNYLNQSILIIEIINSFIIACMVNQITVSQSSFDSLFVSYISRTKISIIKIASILLLIILYLIIEIVIISLIGYFEYPYYKPNSVGLNLLLYLLQSSLLEISVSFFISILINNNFSMIISFILFIGLIFLKSNLASNIDMFDVVVPLYQIHLSDFQIPYIGYIVTILFLIFFVLIYKIKNIKI